MDDHITRWEERIKADSLEDWINVSERTKMTESKIAKNYFVSSIPVYFLIDKNGMIVYKLDGSQDEEGNKKFENAVMKALE